LLEQTVSGLEQPSQNWGTAGRREDVFSETGRFVSFYYRPHLFPGMELKLRLAHELQYRLLPRKLPPGSPVSIAAVLESYCHLSGDLFGWEMLRDGKFLVWIVDMAGHGLRAGLGSAVIKVLIDNLEERSRLETMLAELNRRLHECIRPEHDSLYATSFFMTLDRDGRAVYSSAGHPPVLLRRADGRIDKLDALDLPLGLFPDTTYSCREFRLNPQDFVLLYTDGLIEARGRDDQAFGLDRLRGILARPFDRCPELTGAIYEEITGRQDIDKLDDDVTFLAARPSVQG
jgi:sigma-B regulation protein RsbU (phosphoserine phosphatase)